ncbi:ABC transporter permease [Oerskovia flava]|uniref:ABC transporter permease n=1 Tax=Oerskovia flava TaxID=2986422 RepID=UPI002240180A|nr:ABC transporter permease [Oerskovia sp. JB1-3-2]
MTSDGPTQDGSRELAELATSYGLRPLGERDKLSTYTRELWRRRAFVWTLASSRAYSRNQNNYLGQLWSVLNPLLLAIVYYLVFGVLLSTTAGVDNFAGFLVIGIFIFTFIGSSLQAGANSVLSNTGLVRALKFPRAVLPLSVTLAELVTLLPALGVMVVIVLFTGEPLSWQWLTLIPAVLLTQIFTSGASFILARVVVSARDLRNLIPVAIRLLRYVSGVFYSIATYVDEGVLGAIMYYQPVAVYLNLVRSALLEQFDADLTLWIAGVAWAFVLLVVGYVVFWKAEERYGRD